MMWTAAAFATKLRADSLSHAPAEAINGLCIPAVYANGENSKRRQDRLIDVVYARHGTAQIHDQFVIHVWMMYSVGFW